MSTVKNLTNRKGPKGFRRGPLCSATDLVSRVAEVQRCGVVNVRLQPIWVVPSHGDRSTLVFADMRR